MKKIFITLVLLVFAVFCVKAQTNIYHPFPDSNAIWHEHFEWANQKDSACYYSYSLCGDTLINSFLYSKLYYFNDTALNSNAVYYGCLREDSLKRVFYIGRDFWGMHNFTQEIQLYDFSKNGCINEGRIEEFLLLAYQVYAAY